MANGDLRTFLRASRPNVARPRQTLDARDLTAIASQAAAAMAFLERHHVVHRSLSARHFLVGRDAHDLRLANIGSTRDIYLVCMCFSFK